jgi:hypothetical protein
MYCSPNIWVSPNIIRVIKSRIMGWAELVARTGERRDVYRVLVGKREVKRQLGRYRRKLEGNIEMDLQKVGCGSMDWICLARDRYVQVAGSCKCCNEPSGSIKCGEFLD